MLIIRRIIFVITGIYLVHNSSKNTASASFQLFKCFLCIPVPDISRFDQKDCTIAASSYHCRINYCSDRRCIDQEIIYSTNFPNMDIIFGGPSAPNPSGLLSENIFKVFLKEIREYYNYILIDTPPIGTVIDAYNKKNNICHHWYLSCS